MLLDSPTAAMPEFALHGHPWSRHEVFCLDPDQCFRLRFSSNRSVVSLVAGNDRVQHGFVIVKPAVFSQAQVPVEDDADRQSGFRRICTVFTNHTLDLFAQQVCRLDLAYATLSSRICKLQGCLPLSHRIGGDDGVGLGAVSISKQQVCPLKLDAICEADILVSDERMHAHQLIAITVRVDTISEGVAILGQHLFCFSACVSNGRFALPTGAQRVADSECSCRHISHFSFSIGSAPVGLLVPWVSSRHTETAARHGCVGRSCEGRNSCCKPSTPGRTWPARPGRRAATQ